MLLLGRGMHRASFRVNSCASAAPSLQEQICGVISSSDFGSKVSLSVLVESPHFALRVFASSARLGGVVTEIILDWPPAERLDAMVLFRWTCTLSRCESRLFLSARPFSGS